MSRRRGSDWWKLDHDRFWDDPDVLLMAPEVAGIYLFLLGLQNKYGALPDDASALRKLTLRFPNRVWKRAWSVLEPFFPRTDNGRENPVQRRIIADIEDSRASARERQNAKRDREKADSARDSRVTSRTDVTVERRGEERRGEEKEEKPPAGAGAFSSAPPGFEDSEPDVVALAEHWRDEWRRTRRAEYVLRPIDRASLVTVLDLAGGELAEARRRITRLIDDVDPYEFKKASPGYIVRSDVWNRLGAGVPPPVRDSANGKAQTPTRVPTSAEIREADRKLVEQRRARDAEDAALAAQGPRPKLLPALQTQPVAGGAT